MLRFKRQVEITISLVSRLTLTQPLPVSIMKITTMMNTLVVSTITISTTRAVFEGLTAQ